MFSLRVAMLRLEYILGGPISSSRNLASFCSALPIFGSKISTPFSHGWVVGWIKTFPPQNAWKSRFVFDFTFPKGHVVFTIRFQLTIPKVGHVKTAELFHGTFYLLWTFQFGCQKHGSVKKGVNKKHHPLGSRIGTPTGRCW